MTNMCNVLNKKKKKKEKFNRFCVEEGDTEILILSPKSMLWKFHKFNNNKF